MGKTFEAVYENGVLRPLVSVELAEQEHVFLTISGDPDGWADPSEFFTPEEWALAQVDTITHEEVREALSSLPGSLADAVIESRRERCDPYWDNH